jgi:hypothetical protein
LALGFWDKEDDEDDEANIGCHEEVERITMKWSVSSLQMTQPENELTVPCWRRRLGKIG